MTCDYQTSREHFLTHEEQRPQGVDKMNFLKQIILFIFICCLVTTITFSQSDNQNQEDVKALSNRLKKTVNDREKVDILNMFVDYLWGIDLDAAQKYAQKALNLAEKINYHEGIVDAYNNLGFIEFYRSKYEEALAYCKQALNRSYKSNYNDGFVESYNGVGRYYQVKGNFDKALDKFLVSKNICQQIGNKRELAYCYYGLGAIHFYDRGSYYNEALEYFKKSLELREDVGDKNGITSSLYAIGEAYKKQEDYTNALQYFQKCLELSKKIGNRYNIANAYEGIGDIHIKGKKYEEAFGYYEKSLKIFEEFGESFQRAALHIRYGDYYKKIRQYESALWHLDTAFNIAKEKRIPMIMKDAAEELVNMHLKLKQKNQAKKYEEISAKQNVFLKDNEMIKLKIFSDLERDKERKRIFWVYFISAFFLLIVSPLLFRSYRIKRKSLKNVERLNEIGKVLTSSLSQKEIYDSVYKNVKELMPVEVFLIFSYDCKSKKLVFIGGKEKGVEDSSQFYTLLEVNRPAVKCFNDQKPIIFKDYQKEYPKLFGTNPPLPKVGESFNSHIFLPLTIEEKNGKKNKKIGVITVQSSKKNAYKYLHVNILKNIANYAAIALDNADAYKELKQVNDLKSWLLEMAAHDLKYPLQIIIGFSEQIGKKLKNDSNALEHLERIKKSSNQMERLINELLEDAAIENGKIKLEKSTVDICKLAESVIEENKNLIDKKKQELIFSYEKNCLVQGDEGRLQEIIDNLISNSIKFSPKGKKIWVKVGKNETQCVLKVRDDGPGLTEEDKTKLFKKFQRLSARPTGGELAIGLGLAITKYLVVLHGGQLRAESEHGKGATFIVEIPLCETAAVPGADEKNSVTEIK